MKTLLIVIIVVSLLLAGCESAPKQVAKDTWAEEMYTAFKARENNEITIAEYQKIMRDISFRSELAAIKNTTAYSGSAIPPMPMFIPVAPMINYSGGHGNPYIHTHY